MPIAGPASAPVRARPLTVAARVGALWDEVEAGLTRLRGIHLSGLARISLAHIGRPHGGHKPHRGQRERAEYS